MSSGTIKRSILGSYRLVDFLGAGGMGEVYRGIHLSTGRLAAVKVLTTAARSPSMAERFRNEARIQSTLSHPHIVTLYDFFEAEGFPCIAMEYVAGQSLDQVLQAGPLPAERALPLFRQIVDAVGYIHHRGIVHRDLKSTNIRIDEAGRIKLLDFGIAKSHDSPKLTTDGSVVGTLHYISPEQVNGGAATRASDIWALGVVLYEMVTGRVPFSSDTLDGLMARILSGAYDPPSRDGVEVPREVERLISRCLRIEPSQRYPSAEALFADLPAAAAPSAPVPGLMAPVARTTGEVARFVRRRGLLSASVALAAGALGFVVWSSFICCEPVPIEPVNPATRDRTSGGQPGADRPALAEPGRLPAAAVPDSSTYRRVIIKVFGAGAAEVWRDGTFVGPTPVEFRAPIGQWIEITLKRPGSLDLSKRFQVVDGVNEYTYDLALVPRGTALWRAPSTIPSLAG